MVYIDGILDVKDIRKLENSITSIVDLKKDIHVAEGLDPGLFMIASEDLDDISVIEMLSERLYQLEYIDDIRKFTSAVLEREQLHSTKFSNIWIPHPVKAIGLKNAIAVMLLPNRKEICFLISLAKGSSTGLKNIYARLSCLIDDEEIMKKLINSPDFISFSTLFSQL